MCLGWGITLVGEERANGYGIDFSLLYVVCS